MLRNRLYYSVKPLMPWSVRMGLRRWHAQRHRRQAAGIWPIFPGSEQPPADWPGWPDGRQFALVLTHDVEGPEGLAKVKPLAKLEMSLGFRSCFNFIPEGSYRVPRELRDWLARHGFEVGVHDLRHDGNLFRNRQHFGREAARINAHLTDWGAVGFRAGFMMNQPDWLHDLRIQYDCSTFDTDPFEPQPHGQHTIFPFWVAGPEDRRQKTEDRDPSSVLRSPSSAVGDPGVNGQSSVVSPSSVLRPPSSGYAELPYTLPQDSTLFLLFREATPEIWLRKLDWIAQHGGMAMVNVHPDYVQMEGEPASPRTYPVGHYLALLHHVRSLCGLSGSNSELRTPNSEHSTSNPPASELPLSAVRSQLSESQSVVRGPGVRGHRSSNESSVTSPRSSALGPPLSPSRLSLAPSEKSSYWNALPREMAAFVAQIRPEGTASGESTRRPVPSRAGPKPKIWIDLDNTPHVPFFEPILDELRARGYPVLVTARDAFQVCDLADTKQLPYLKVGRHHGKNRLLKAVGLAYRAAQLAPHVLREKPLLAVSHGARSQLILANCLGVPSLLIEDYEFCQFPPMMKPTWLMSPQVIPDSALLTRNGHLHKYPGIKEDVYAWKLRPDFGALQSLGLSPQDLLITVRPPATEAHYHNPESEKLFEHFMHHACRHPQARLVLLPRNQKQGDLIRHQWPGWFAEGKTIIPPGALDGMNLIWHSDLVVSGGGTMNREAAALGVPVYSIFRGTIGAVDRHLSATSRLTLIESLADVEQKIRIVKRPRRTLEETTSRQTLNHIVRTIIDLAESSAR